MIAGVRIYLVAALLNVVCTAADTAQAVRALLAAKCEMCHSDQAMAGGLSLTSIDNMRKGGKRGPAVLPGNPRESLLFRLISGAQPAMPFRASP